MGILRRPSIRAKEVDGTPSGPMDTLEVPNGSLAFTGRKGTLTFPGGGGGSADVTDLLTGQDQLFTSTIGNWVKSSGPDTLAWDATYFADATMGSAKWHSLGSSSQYIEVTVPVPAGGQFAAGTAYDALVVVAWGQTNKTLRLSLGHRASADIHEAERTSFPYHGNSGDWMFVHLRWRPTANRASATLRIMTENSSATDLYVGWARVAELGPAEQVGLIITQHPSEVADSRYHIPAIVQLGPGDLGDNSGYFRFNGLGEPEIVGPGESDDYISSVNAGAKGIVQIIALGDTASPGNPSGGGGAILLDVGPDFVGIAILEKDSSTVQIVDDGLGAYDIELLEAGTFWKFVTVDGDASIPSMGMLRNLAAEPGSPLESESYYDTVLHKTRVWDGTVWQDTSGSGLSYVPSTSVRLTSGNITIGNSQSAHAAITATALDLTIAAAIGDVLEISISRLHQNSGTGETFFDVASVVAGVLTNYASGGSGTGGIMGLYRTNNTPNFLGQAATIQYTVVAGDISGGNVLLRPVAYNTGNANGVVYCQATYPIHFSVVNLKH